jgi:hypothetical protein
MSNEPKTPGQIEIMEIDSGYSPTLLAFVGYVVILGALIFSAIAIFVVWRRIKYGQ